MMTQCRRCGDALNPSIMHMHEDCIGSLRSQRDEARAKLAEVEGAAKDLDGLCTRALSRAETAEAKLARAATTIIKLTAWYTAPFTCPDCSPIGKHETERRHEHDCGLLRDINDAHVLLANIAKEDKP